MCAQTFSRLPRWHLKLPPPPPPHTTTCDRCIWMSGLAKWQQHASDAQASGGCVIKPVPKRSRTQLVEVPLAIPQQVCVCVSKATRHKELVKRLRQNETFSGCGKHYALSTRVIDMALPTAVLMEAIKSLGHTCVLGHTWCKDGDNDWENQLDTIREKGGARVLVHLESGHQESETAMGELMFSLKVVEVEIGMTMEEVDGELAACRFFHSTKEVADAENQLRTAQARCVHAASAPRQACQCHARGRAQAMHVNIMNMQIPCACAHSCACQAALAEAKQQAVATRAAAAAVRTER